MPPDDDRQRDDRQRLVDRYTEIAQLAGGLAHEIKNPLSTIRLNMELLAEDFADADSPRERRALRRLEVMQRECQRLQDLLDDYLRFVRVRDPQLESSDLNAEIERVLDLFQPTADEASIEVTRYLDPDLPIVRLDSETFQSALWNLILNARQAMPDGGQLMVRTMPHGASVAIDLIDTGCGMSEKTASSIFEPFYSTKPGGSGLGLPTTGKIVEAHGGRIQVQSEEGRGTRFTIELPLPARLESG